MIVGEMRCRLDAGDALLRFSETLTTISVDVVLVPAASRGRGIGTALLKRVLLLADATSRPVQVAARPIGATGEAPLQRLVAFYRRFGFEESGRGVSVVYMLRPPAACCASHADLMPG